MATNSQISKLNLKNKPSKQKQNHRYGDHLEGCQLVGGRERMEKKVQALRSTSW